MKEPGLRELKAKLDRLEWIELDPKVVAAKNIVWAERKPQVDAIKAKIAELQSKRPEPKPRWPLCTPPKVLAICEAYWRGTTEYHTFRIHCWNDKVVCTSWPSGGYSDNGGWHATSACFHFLSLNEKEHTLGSNRPKTIGKELVGRQSAKQLESALAERTS